MAPIGSSISLRLVGFLLAAVVLFNFAMGIAFFSPVGGPRGEAGRLPIPAQMAAIVDVLDAAQPQERPRMLVALNSSALSIRLVDALPIEQAAKQSAPAMTRFLESYDEAFASRDIHVDLQRRGLILGFNDDPSGWSTLRVYVRLADSKWVMIQPVRTELLNGVLWRGLLIVGLAGLVVIILLIIAVRQTTRPIVRLAGNARTFADQLDAPDLDEKGPKELRDLARAFNEMKMRIRSLVQERTRLVASIAHDLRTYMTRLGMRAEFISDPVQRERAEIDIAEMSALIGDTLLFARSVEVSQELGVATEVAAELERFVMTRKEVGEVVEIIPPSDHSLLAVIEPVALRRALANLTDNAVRYGGSAELSAIREGAVVLVDVADRGPGIPESELERMTAPFERLESSRGRDTGGAGLGLAIVKALVERHGGAFTLLNRSGGGIIARLSLRLADRSSNPELPTDR